METIESRIEKKEAVIAKLEARIAKLLDKYGDATIRQLVAEGKLEELREYLKGKGIEWYSEPFSIYYKLVELRDSKVTLTKYYNMLKLKQDKAKVVKIPVIWDFLMQYKAMLSKYFHENAVLYYQLKQGQQEAWEKCKTSELYLSRISRWGSQYRAELAWRQEYYEPIHSLTRELYKHPGKIDEARLEQYLDRDIENRYFKLVNQVTKIVGDIIDADELFIRNGELNGYIRGEKGRCVVMTIGAGGYNIQCFHYRTIVREVKK